MTRAVRRIIVQGDGVRVVHRDSHDSKLRANAVTAVNGALQTADAASRIDELAAR
jgi:hypothetical protein